MSEREPPRLGAGARRAAGSRKTYTGGPLDVPVLIGVDLDVAAGRADRDRRRVRVGQEHAAASAGRPRCADRGRGRDRGAAVRVAVGSRARAGAQPRARLHLSVPSSAARIHRARERRDAALRAPHGAARRAAAAAEMLTQRRPRASAAASARRAVGRRAAARRARARAGHAAALRARRRADRQSRPAHGGAGVRPDARPQSRRRHGARHRHARSRACRAHRSDAASGRRTAGLIRTRGALVRDRVISRLASGAGLLRASYPSTDGRSIMVKGLIALFAGALLGLAPVTSAQADEYSDTIALFKKAGQSSRYFSDRLRLCGVPHDRQGRGGDRGCARQWPRLRKGQVHRRHVDDAADGRASSSAARRSARSSSSRISGRCASSRAATSSSAPKPPRSRLPQVRARRRVRPAPPPPRAARRTTRRPPAGTTGHGHLHRGERRPHVRGCAGRSEVQLRAALTAGPPRITMSMD